MTYMKNVIPTNISVGFMTLYPNSFWGPSVAQTIIMFCRPIVYNVSVSFQFHTLKMNRIVKFIIKEIVSNKIVFTNNIKKNTNFSMHGPWWHSG